jgi:hypothetical protein
MVLNQEDPLGAVAFTRIIPDIVFGSGSVVAPGEWLNGLFGLPCHAVCLPCENVRDGGTSTPELAY